MPDVYSERVALEFHIPGALSTGLTTMRRMIPFPYQILGVSASVNTAPVGANLIFDVLTGANNTASLSLVSLWTVNNGTNVQLVTITGSPTGGTFTLTFNGQTTGSIAYNATAATVQSALNLLSTIPAGVTVTGSNGGPYTVTFNSGSSSGVLMTFTGSLTGGTTPSLTIVGTGTDHRPTIVAGSYDQALIAATTLTVAPLGTDPALQSGVPVSTTYTNPDPFPYLAKPDGSTLNSNFVGAYAGGSPEYEGQPSPVVISGTGGSESAGVPQLPSAQASVFQGNAGDAINVYIRQVGSSTAGSDATVTVYAIPA